MLPYVAKETADVIKGESLRVKNLSWPYSEKELWRPKQSQKDIAGLKTEKEHHELRNKGGSL